MAVPPTSGVPPGTIAVPRSLLILLSPALVAALLTIAFLLGRETERAGPPLSAKVAVAEPPSPTTDTDRVARARRRCPHCGQGPVFVRWMTMHDTCSVCGLRYLRNQGDTWLYWIVMDRIPLAVGLILFVFFGVNALTWQSGLLFFGSLAIPLVIAMPQRQGLAIAMNYLSRVYFPDPSDTFPPPWEGGVSRGRGLSCRFRHPDRRRTEDPRR